MITVRSLTKRYGKRHALTDVSFGLGPGVTGLLGPNGAGKTTLIRCMLGVTKPTAGSITYQDRVGPLSQHVGYLPQRFGLLKELTVAEALTYLATLKRIPNDAVESAIGECLRSVNMLDSAATRVGALSGGMLRRVGIAGALLGDPKVLLFDEPTAGLDPEERVRFKRLVSTLAETRTVLISTHIVEDIEALAGAVIVLHHGAVAAAGTLEEIASLARGLCYLAPRDIVNEHADDYYVDEYTEVDGAHFAKILSPRAYPGFVNRDPSVQDGYLCVTRGLT